MYFVGTLINSDGEGNAYIGRIDEPLANDIADYLGAWAWARRYKQCYPQHIFVVGGDFQAPEDPKREPVSVE
jgi:hypothetical protein